ncbi:MAG: TIGR01548 family HAD-type hydrolase [Planctomycetes bacterium]|nr:TIGR01548 family HAD-type hydrolase [Planctomycetota bacterium]
MNAAPPTAVAGEVRPISRLNAAPYSRTRDPRPIDLRLDANEGAAPPAELLASIPLEAGIAGTYPSAAALEAQLAAHWGVASQSVVVTAGADDALERICRAVLEPGREALMTDPTFEMLPRWVAACGAAARTASWMSGGFPVDKIESLLNAETRVIFVVSPNNPTGLSATAADVLRLAEAAPNALVVADLAYVEFAESDLTREVLGRHNVVVTRTFSKAWGLAGMRVGYAIAPERVAHWMRTVGMPYACSGYSVQVAKQWFAQGGGAMARFTGVVREERSLLAKALAEHGIEFVPSDANFIFAKFKDAALVADLLAGLGISVRRYGGSLANYLRISVPADAAAGERLRASLRSILRPRALLFDMDGVLADVSESYRETIRRTAAEFGVEITRADIARIKAAGNANNDWVVTRSLLAEKGVQRSLEEVTAAFERIYQGTEEKPGLRRTERLLASRNWLESLRTTAALGVVTGRPRADAERFLRERGIADLFDCVVCMEDSVPKPSPRPVQIALERLGVREAWLVGDTPDDIVAARAAGVTPIGCVAPGDDLGGASELLLRTGAGRVIERVEQLTEILP